jgi:microcystin-dependent protein
MSDPFLCEIRIVSFNFAPKGWAACNGQLLPINQNQALFSLLGTTYGGNGQTNFALPNLQGDAPIHQGSTFFNGQVGGENTHTLALTETPAHTHSANGYNAAGNAAPGATTVWAQGLVSGQPVHSLYSATSNTTMNPSVLANAGGGQPHENRQPFLVLNFVIALTGIFPSRT